MTWGAGEITIHIHKMLYARIGIEQSPVEQRIAAAWIILVVP